MVSGEDGGLAQAASGADQDRGVARETTKRLAVGRGRSSGGTGVADEGTEVLRLAAAIIFSHSPGFIAMGFSQRTWHPALAASMVGAA